MISYVYSLDLRVLATTDLQPASWVRGSKEHVYIFLGGDYNWMRGLSVLLGGETFSQAIMPHFYPPSLLSIDLSLAMGMLMLGGAFAVPSFSGSNSLFIQA